MNTFYLPDSARHAVELLRAFNAAWLAALFAVLALAPEAGALHGKYLDERQQVQPPAAAARELPLQELLLTRSTRWTGLDQAGA